MELANGVVVREHGRTKKGSTEVGVCFICLLIIRLLFLETVMLQRMLLCAASVVEISADCRGQL